MMKLKSFTQTRKLKKKLKNNEPKAQKKGKKSQDLQETDPLRATFAFQEIFPSGICQIDDITYSTTIELEDINYQLSSEDNQIEIFSQYCDFLNSLSSKTKLQLTVYKKKRPLADLQKVLYYQEKGDFLDDYRSEMNEVISRKLDEEKNGYRKCILFTFVQKHTKIEHAEKELEMVADRFAMFASRLGSKIKRIEKTELLTILSEILGTDDKREKQKVEDVLPEVIEIKENKNYLKVDTHYAKTIYLQEYPSELADTFLYELLEIPKELVITLHIDPLEQDEAFDLVKTKLAFMEQQKVDEQKKALQNGYEYEMLSYDLSYSLTEAKGLVDDLQNRGQKLYAMTSSIHFRAGTTEQLAEIQDEVNAVGRRFGFKIIELEFMQENGLNATLPLGINSIPLDRTLSTASTAIFIPFTISDLIQENGKYYGVNAISKNILSLDRKLLKAPNGFVLGTPGSGKSFSVKREIVNVLLRDAEDEVIIIDPEREYSVIGQNFNGEIIKISSDSATTINPMDINENYGDDTDPVVLKSEAGEAATHAAHFGLSYAYGEEPMAVIEKSPDWFTKIMQVIMPNNDVAMFFQKFMVFFEIALALALIAGLFTWLCSATTIVLVITFCLSGMFYWVNIWFIFVAFALMNGSGRAIGLDRWVIPWLQRTLGNWWYGRPSAQYGKK